MLYHEKLASVVDVLDNEYYSIGVSSGHEALATLLDDHLYGRLDDFLGGWGITDNEFRCSVFFTLVSRWIVQGKMHQPHAEWANLTNER